MARNHEKRREAGPNGFLDDLRLILTSVYSFRQGISKLNTSISASFDIRRWWLFTSQILHSFKLLSKAHRCNVCHLNNVFRAHGLEIEGNHTFIWETQHSSLVHMVIGKPNQETLGSKTKVQKPQFLLHGTPIKLYVCSDLHFHLALHLHFLSLSQTISRADRKS